jgi:hypothetical protein
VSSPVPDSDKFKALNVRLGSVRSNGVCTMDLITLLVNKLREVIEKKKEDCSQQKQFKNLQDHIRQVKLGEKPQSSLLLNIGSEV